MSNELIEALKEAKNGSFLKGAQYINKIDSFTMLKDIEHILSLQRQECAEKAHVEMTNLNYGTPSTVYMQRDGYAYSVDKETILNAKII